MSKSPSTDETSSDEASSGKRMTRHRLPNRVPPVFDRLLKQLRKRMRDGKVSLSRDETRGIIAKVDRDYTDNVWKIDDVFRLLLNEGVLIEQQGSFRFDPIQSARTLAIAEREDPDRAEEKARKSLQAASEAEIDLAASSDGLPLPTPPIKRKVTVAARPSRVSEFKTRLSALKAETSSLTDRLTRLR